MAKPRAIYFFQYLPTWRIDVFNKMSVDYDLTIVFWNAEAAGFTYDRQGLLGRLAPSIRTVFLNQAFEKYGTMLSEE